MPNIQCHTRTKSLQPKVSAHLRALCRVKSQVASQWDRENQQGIIQRHTSTLWKKTWNILCSSSIQQSDVCN